MNSIPLPHIAIVILIQRQWISRGIRVPIDRFIFKRGSLVRDLHSIQQIGARGNVRSRSEYPLARHARILSENPVVLLAVAFIYSLSALPSLYIYNVTTLPSDARFINTSLKSIQSLIGLCSATCSNNCPPLHGNNGVASTRRTNSPLRRNHPRRAKHRRPLSPTRHAIVPSVKLAKTPSTKVARSFGIEVGQRDASSPVDLPGSQLMFSMTTAAVIIRTRHPGQACPRAPETRATWASRRSASV